MPLAPLPRPLPACGEREVAFRSFRASSDIDRMDAIIIGAGGHGRVVLDILRARGEHSVVGFIDANTSLAGSEISGVPVIGPPNQLPKLRQRSIAAAIVAIGDNRTRLRYAQTLLEQGFELLNA